MGYNKKRIARIERLRHKRKKEAKKEEKKRKKRKKKEKRQSKIEDKYVQLEEVRDPDSDLMVHNADGLSVEREVFGMPPGGIIDVRNPPEYKSYKMALKEAILLAKKTPWNGFLPNTPLARKLYFAVKKAFSNVAGQASKGSSLRLWPTHGTAFDFYHGADAVFVLDNRWWVTLDVSTIEKEEIKSDFLVLPMKFRDPEGYLKKLGREIAERMWQKRIEFSKTEPLLQE